MVEVCRSVVEVCHSVVEVRRSLGGRARRMGVREYYAPTYCRGARRRARGTP